MDILFRMPFIVVTIFVALISQSLRTQGQTVTTLPPGSGVTTAAAGSTQPTAAAGPTQTTAAAGSTQPTAAAGPTQTTAAAGSTQPTAAATPANATQASSKAAGAGATVATTKAVATNATAAGPTAASKTTASTKANVAGTRAKVTKEATKATETSTQKTPSVRGTTVATEDTATEDVTGEDKEQADSINDLLSKVQLKFKGPDAAIDNYKITVNPMVIPAACYKPEADTSAATKGEYCAVLTEKAITQGRRLEESDEEAVKSQITELANDIADEIAESIGNCSSYYDYTGCTPSTIEKEVEHVATPNPKFKKIKASVAAKKYKELLSQYKQEDPLSASTLHLPLRPWFFTIPVFIFSLLL